MLVRNSVYTNEFLIYVSFEQCNDPIKSLDPPLETIFISSKVKCFFTFFCCCVFVGYNKGMRVTFLTLHIIFLFTFIAVVTAGQILSDCSPFTTTKLMSPPSNFNESNEDSVANNNCHDSAAHSQATLDLAKKESAEHMHGMEELVEEMKKRNLQIQAYALDDPNAPTDDGGKTVKTVHFVRHGQGFHNLMADIASSEGREWIQVSFQAVTDIYTNFATI